MLLDREINIDTIVEDRDELARVLQLLKTLKDLTDSAKGASLTVSINGDWGTGKTSILRTIESFYRDYCGFPVVFFEAWKHQDDDNYLFSLLLELRDAITGRQIKGRITKVMKTVGLSLADWYMKEKAKLSIEDIKESFKLVEEGYFLYSSRRKENFKKLKELIRAVIESGGSKIDSVLQEIWKNLDSNEELSPKNLKPKSKKLVIIIDDLDRLVPENAFRMIESIRFYFDVESVVIIMGINDRVLESYVKQRFYIGNDDTSYSDNFLEKIFNYSYSLSSSKINNIHLRCLGDEEKEKVREILSDIDLHLTHRKWTKVINRIVEKEDYAGNLVDSVFSALIYELYPEFEYYSRRYPDIDFLRIMKGNAESHQEKEALKKLLSDTTFLIHPDRTAEKLSKAYIRNVGRYEPEDKT
jgi:hypothetical protein